MTLVTAQGPLIVAGATRFRVWAPAAERVDLILPDRRVAMEREEGGYHAVVVDAPSGTRYAYSLDGGEPVPDPASRWQPDGVHASSAVVDPSAFVWNDHAWAGVPLPDYVVYEIHVGTFTSEGTFDALSRHLGELRALGITAIEIMPIAQFPGTRDWGYDGVFPYAAQESYGGPDGFARLVDRAHAEGLAVVLDVVYNHLGPEGNRLGLYGPYFTERYRTPWGDAVNVDGEHSDEVRRYFIDNACMWIDDYHVDALRLDAVHGIVDTSARPFLRELADAVHGRAEVLGRPAYLIAESDANDVRLLAPPDLGGYGMDAQWSDDVHHAVHALLTGERDGYYEDFGSVEMLVRAMRSGFAFTGDHSSFRKRRHGSDPAGVAPHRFVVCSQNHDQVGNRQQGDRLSRLVEPDALRLAAGLILLSPFTPLLFMGEEYGETAPFQYFVSHSDEELIASVREGRAREFEAFGWSDETPDPQDEKTFMRSKLDRSLRNEQGHRELEQLYADVLSIRRSSSAFGAERAYEVSATGDLMQLRYIDPSAPLAIVYNLGVAPAAVPPEHASWRRVLDSDARRYGGGGGDANTIAPRSFVVLAPLIEETASE